MTGAINAMLGGGSNYPGVVTVSGATILHTVSDPNNAFAIVIVRADGTIDRDEGGSVTQLSASTDWIIPNSEASGDFEVRFTLQSGDTPNTGNSSTGSWLALSSDRSIGYSQGVVGTSSGVILVEIRYLSGAAIDSGEYDITAQVRT